MNFGEKVQIGKLGPLDPRRRDTDIDLVLDQRVDHLGPRRHFDDQFNGRVFGMERRDGVIKGRGNEIADQHDPEMSADFRLDVGEPGRNFADGAGEVPATLG